MTDQARVSPSEASDRVTVERLPNGYWKATIRLPWPPGDDYVQTANSFHDEQEARDWAEHQIGFLTTPEEAS